MEPRALQDVEDIKQLKARFARLVDAQDWDGWADLLTEDYRFKSDAGTVDGRAAVVAMVREALVDATTVHKVFAPEITLMGPNDADGSWAIEDLILIPSDPPLALRLHSRCEERYRREGATWRVSETVESTIHTETLEPQ